MKKNKSFAFLRICILLLMVAVAGGCANPWRTGADNVANSRRLRVGMTKSDVLGIMGEPAKDEQFNNPDLWHYYIRPNWLDGMVTEDECMPLIFENGKLVGWGHKFYIDYRLKRKNSAPQHK